MRDDIRPKAKPSRPKPKPLETLKHLTVAKPSADIEINMDEHDKVTDEKDNSGPTKVPKSILSFLTPKKGSTRKPLTKKQKIILISSGVVVVALLVTGGFLLFGNDHKKAASKTVAKALPPKPAPVYISRLTGEKVTKAESILPVTGVMIENSDAARPQSGLSQAGVVFEAVAEGGVTRFLALFEEGQPNSIGPVRSARPYYVDWLLGFDAAYAHVGGSPDGLSAIQTLHVKDLNEFYNAGAYQRISSREPPHNVYTSMSNLLSLETSKGYSASNFTGFPRKPDAPLKTPSTTAIDINPSGPDFASHYDYDKAGNGYRRSEGGAGMSDANGNTTIEPKVVVALVMSQSYGALDATGAYYTEYQDIGNGTAYIFQDGTFAQGTWTKSSPTSQITFTDSNGNPIKLNAGQTWITVVGSTNYVSYH